MTEPLTPSEQVAALFSIPIPAPHRAPWMLPRGVDSIGALARLSADVLAAQAGDSASLVALLAEHGVAPGLVPCQAAGLIREAEPVLSARQRTQHDQIDALLSSGEPDQILQGLELLRALCDPALVLKATGGIVLEEGALSHRSRLVRLPKALWNWALVHGGLALAWAGVDPAPTELWLFRQPFGDAGLALLAGEPGLRAVQRLEMWGPGVTDVGIRALVASPHLGALEHVRLAQNDIGPEGAGLLARRGLSWLDLRYNPIGAAGAAALAQHHRGELLLEFDDVGEAGARHLAASLTLPPAVVARWVARLHHRHPQRSTA